MSEVPQAFDFVVIGHRATKFIVEEIWNVA